MTSGTEPFGLHVPTLSKGAPADVVLVDLGAEWEVGEAGYESRSANNAFAGQRLTGRVRMTAIGAFIDSALDQTGFPANRVMVNLANYGNTSGASVPIALDEAIRGGRARPGDTVLLVAFGGGLTWGSVLLTL